MTRITRITTAAWDTLAPLVVTGTLATGTAIAFGIPPGWQSVAHLVTVATAVLVTIAGIAASVGHVVRRCAEFWRRWR